MKNEKTIWHLSAKLEKAIWYTQHGYENTHVSLPFEWGS